MASGAIGAGMFSLPIISTGLWFGGSILVMILVWAANLTATLLYVDANLRYPAGASFNQVVRGSLKPTWVFFSNIGIAFVLYILLYAFFSASGSILNKLFASSIEAYFSVTLGQAGFSFIFGALVAVLVWTGTKAVGRMCAILIIAMGISFALVTGGLLAELNPKQLFTLSTGELQFALPALPYFVTAFACTALVPSLVSYYHKDRVLIKQSFLWGTLIALIIYALWNAAVFGILDRQAMLTVIAAGGNMGELVSSLQSNTSQMQGQSLDYLLALFSCFAISTSFLSIGVSLVDFLSDRFDFTNTGFGRGKAVMFSFAPPAILSLAAPNGFVLAIGYAGLAVLFCFYFIPALIALKPSKTSEAIHTDAGGRILQSKCFIALLLIFTGVAAISKLLILTETISVYP